MVHYYAACKSMVLSLTKALNAELRQQNSMIRVTVSTQYLKSSNGKVLVVWKETYLLWLQSLSPGIVKSEFHEQRAALADTANQSAMKQLDEFHTARNVVIPLHTKDIQDAVIYIVSAPAHVNIRELIIAPINQKT